MKFDFNLADFFKLPTKIMFALALASGMVLFLPDNIVAKINAYAPLTIRVLAGCRQTSQNKRKSAV